MMVAQGKKMLNEDECDAMQCNEMMTSKEMGIGCNATHTPRRKVNPQINVGKRDPKHITMTNKVDAQTVVVNDGLAVWLSPRLDALMQRSSHQ